MTDTPTLHPIIAALHPEAQAVVVKHIVDMANTPTGEPHVSPATFLAMLSGVTAPPAPSRPEPAVPIKKSVTPDYIICLEDGKKTQDAQTASENIVRHDAG